jgi:formylglycine-generating enzyme required for sulfatase activity
MKWGRIALVIFSALIITALGIDAADTIHGSKGTLLSQVLSSSSKGGCPQGMSPVEAMPTMTCVDTYEVSTAKACPVENPDQMVATQKNVESKECLPESKKSALPWRFITRDQAMQMCARVGKRLPTSEEWYALSLGMSDVENGCNVASKNLAVTGSFAGCMSPHGIYDLVGNAWEWVNGDVVNGSYQAVTVPQSGYVAQVDGQGMATVVNENPQDLFGKDYFWSRADGAYGIIRGGYYDSGTDAGIYTVHADTVPTTASIGIGFRCVK